VVSTTLVMLPARWRGRYLLGTFDDEGSGGVAVERATESTESLDLARIGESIDQQIVA